MPIFPATPGCAESQSDPVLEPGALTTDLRLTLFLAPNQQRDGTADKSIKY